MFLRLILGLQVEIDFEMDSDLIWLVLLIIWQDNSQFYVEYINSIFNLQNLQNFLGKFYTGSVLLI